MRIRAATVGRCCEWTLFSLGPLAVGGVSIATFLLRSPGKTDFGTFWTASHAVVHADSPYPTLASLPHAASEWFAPFVYPPLTAFLVAPLGALPFLAAKLAFLALNLAALVLALRLLGVRDWRCYGIAIASPPVVATIAPGAISIVLLLAVAAAWRYRDRAIAVGILVASAVSVKLFLWPLWFWLVRTRRWRAAAVAVGAALAAVTASWAALGFAGLRDYPRLLSRLTGLEGPHSYSAYALQRVVGIGDAHAGQATYALGVMALALALRFVVDDRRLLVALVGVSLIATPILWSHYLVLLFVPLAFASSTLTPAWFLPLLLWVNPKAWNNGHVWPTVAELALALFALAVALRPPTEPQPPVRRLVSFGRLGRLAA